MSATTPRYPAGLRLRMALDLLTTRFRRTAVRRGVRHQAPPGQRAWQGVPPAVSETDAMILLARLR